MTRESTLKESINGALMDNSAIQDALDIKDYSALQKIIDRQRKELEIIHKHVHCDLPSSFTI